MAGGISGMSVALVAAGGILVYAGFKNLSPVGALRDVSGGKPSGVSNVSTDLSAGIVLGQVAAGAAQGAAVLSFAARYENDKYSQAKRTQVGWSDCSSFCDKILTDMGIPIPVKWASTSNYRISPQWVTVPLAETKPGDIAVNSHHMVMITAAGGTAAIGQQNSRVNVRTGTVPDLMSNDYVCKRYVNQGIGGKAVAA